MPLLRTNAQKDLSARKYRHWMSIKAVIYSDNDGSFGENFGPDAGGGGGPAGMDLVTEIDGGAIVRLDEARLVELADQGLRVKVLVDPDRLQVRGRTIDLEKREQDLPRSQRVAAAARDDWNHHIIQFEGPPLPEFLEAVEALGLEIVNQVDRYAVAVVGSAKAAAEAESIPAVAAAVRFEPGFRIAASLDGARGAQVVRVGVHPPEFVAEAAELIASFGAEILMVEDAESNAGRFVRADRTALIRARVPKQSVLNEIASQPWVHFVEPYEENGIEDERSAQIVAEDLDGAAAPNTSPNTGYQNTLAGLGLDGTGVTIGVVDTGIANHNSATLHPDLRGRLAFFADQSGGARNVDGWVSGGRNRGGHGTHVAGIAAGDGSSGDTDPGGFVLGQGVAPAANVGSVNFLAANPQPTVDTVLLAAATNGSDVNNNSWGTSSPNGYDANCTTVDQRVRDPDPTTTTFEEMAIVFSVGNSGGLPGSMTSPHEAKNAIVVGNGLNRRPGEGDFSDDIRGINNSSSRGPTADGRICPTVVAPGTDVISALTTVDANPATAAIDRNYTPYTDTGGTLHNNHTSLTGSSMAAPHVAGLCALLIEWWRDRTGATPSPAMLRALLVNGAEDMADGPNWKRVLVSGAATWTANGANQQFVGLGFTPSVVRGFGNGQPDTAYVQRPSAAQINAAGQWAYAAGTDTLTVRTLNGSLPDRATNVPWDRIYALDAAALTNVPNNDQGWGRASLENIVANAPNSDRGPRIFADQRIAFTANGQSHRIRVAPVDPTRPMRITLAWTDPPGPALVNDLDLVVTEIGGAANVYRGNPANFQNGFTQPGGLNDAVNNIECVYIQNPTGEYDIDIVAAAITTDARDFTIGSPWQDYALVIDNAQVPSAAPVNVSLVLDRSGSMVTSGYVDRTRQASSQFVDLMNIDDSGGVVSFGSNARDEYDDGGGLVDQILGDQQRDDATQAIDNVNFGGLTAMGPGITFGENQLQGAAGNRAIVLLSDGYDNGSPDAATAVAGLANDISLYTCAMGPASDQALLQQLADAANGKYYYMPTIDDLFEIYNWIRGRVTGTAVIANESSQASASRVGAFVDGCAERVTFCVAWPNQAISYTPNELKRASEISVRLRAPNGKLLAARDSLVRTTPGKGYVVFDVDQPAAGQWFVEVETRRQGHTPYTVGGFVESEIQTELIVPSTLLPGQPLDLKTMAFEGRKQLDDIKTEVCVFVPTLNQDEIVDTFGRGLRRRIRTTRGDKIPDAFATLFTSVQRAEKEGVNVGEMRKVTFDLKRSNGSRRPGRSNEILDLRRFRLDLPDLLDRRDVSIDIRDVVGAGGVLGGGVLGGGGVIGGGVLGGGVLGGGVSGGGVLGGGPAAGGERQLDTERPGTYNVVATISGRAPNCGNFVHKQFGSIRIGKPGRRID